MPLLAVGATDVGKRRHNEDTYLISSETDLVVVADGVGGHHAGEVASRITVESVANSVSAGADLDAAIRDANQAVARAVGEGTGKVGMASTVVAATLNDGEYKVAWVGDSRAYLWDGTLKLLTRDHSLIEQLLASGEVKPAEVRNHPQRNVIVQAIGLQTDSDLRVDIARGVLRRGQLLLLCSDGMSDALDNSAIARILAQETSLQSRCSQLVTESIAAGGKDNATVVLVEGEQAGAGAESDGQFVWSFDPRSGRTVTMSGQSPLSHFEEQSDYSPGDTQMMSISEVNRALAESGEPGMRRMSGFLLAALIGVALAVFGFLLLG